MIIAVDTGGTKTLVVRFSDQGAIEASLKFKTPEDQSEYLQQLDAAVREIAGESPIDKISIAMPGYVEAGVVRWFGNLPWINFDITGELRKRFPGAGVVVANDAKLAALGEARSLDTMPNRVMYITVSTGIGIGMVTEGVMSKDLLSTEAGHMILTYNNEQQSWQDIASGRAIHRLYGQYGYEITDSTTWDEIANRISLGLLVLVPTLMPDVIIFGGGIGTHFAQYEQKLTQIIDEKLPQMFTRPELLQAKYPEEAVAYGCYYYAVDELPTA